MNGTNRMAEEVLALMLYPVMVPNLSFVDRFFVWAIRAWAAHHMDITEIWWGLDRGFTQERMPKALIPFDHTMTLIFAGLTRWPDIRCVRCAYLGADEARLLDSFAALQRGDEAAARIALRSWVNASGLRQACKSGLECVTIAAAAGAHLDGATRFPTAAGGRGSSTRSMQERRTS
jgi:hypothetical protein